MKGKREVERCLSAFGNDDNSSDLLLEGLRNTNWTSRTQAPQSVVRQCRGKKIYLEAGECPGGQAGAPWGTSLHKKAMGSHFTLAVGRDREEQEVGGDGSTL